MGLSFKTPWNNRIFIVNDNTLILVGFKVVNLLMLATPVLTALLWFIMAKLADYIDSDRAKCFKK